MPTAKWLEVLPVKSPTTRSTVEAMRTVFATHGRYRVGIIRQIHPNQQDEHARVLLVETKPGHIDTMSYMSVAPVIL